MWNAYRCFINIFKAIVVIYIFFYLKCFKAIFWWNKLGKLGTIILKVVVSYLTNLSIVNLIICFIKFEKKKKKFSVENRTTKMG